MPADADRPAADETMPEGTLEDADLAAVGLKAVDVDYLFGCGNLQNFG